MASNIIIGEALNELWHMRERGVGHEFDCIVTSPPYFGLRDYGMPGQLGLEETVEEYVAKLVDILRAARELLRSDGTLWLNLGDTYANTGTGGNGATGGLDKSTLSGHMPPVGTTPVKRRVPLGLKEKDLIGIPWRVAFALQADGWYLRQDIIWSKPNPMPESVTDRCVKSHEHVFLLSREPRYYFDHEIMREPAVSGARGSTFTKGKTGGHQGGRAGKGERREDGMRNRRDVWSIATQPYKGAHFAVFPEKLAELCLRAGSRWGGWVLDPFAGSGTTLGVAEQFGRNGVGIELNPEYRKLIEERIRKGAKLALGASLN